MPRVSSKEKYTVQAFEIFKVKGLTLNMEEIAQNLGITKKTLYNNFSSKQELIGTVVNYFYSELDNKIQQSIQKSTNATIKKLSTALINAPQSMYIEFARSSEPSSR